MFRILFFVALSFSLHFLSLSFGFNPSAELLKSEQVKVGYVSRSADSFIPEPKSVTQNIKEKDELSKFNYSKNKDTKTKVQHNRQKVPNPIISKSVIPISKTRKVPSPVKSTQAPAVRQAPEISFIKNETIQSEIIEVEALEKPLSMTSPAELDLPELSEQLKDMSVQPLISNVVDSEPFVEKSQLDFVGDKLDEKKNKQPSLSELAGKSDQNSGTQDALPRYAENTPPKYPKIAKLRGWEGEVVFEVSVLKNGRVDELKMSTSSGFRSLDDAARKALSRWKFWPATSLGLPIDSQVMIPVTFTLNPDNSRH